MFLATTQWSVWGECSVTCGGGIQSRTRDCSSGNQAECPPGTIYSEQRDCNDDPCPIGKFNPVISKTTLQGGNPKFSDTLTLFQPGGVLPQHRRGRPKNFPTVTSLSLVLMFFFDSTYSYLMK